MFDDIKYWVTQKPSTISLFHTSTFIIKFFKYDLQTTRHSSECLFSCSTSNVRAYRKTSTSTSMTLFSPPNISDRTNHALWQRAMEKQVALKLRSCFKERKTNLHNQRAERRQDLSDGFVSWLFWATVLSSKGKLYVFAGFIGKLCASDLLFFCLFVNIVL